MTKNRFLLMTSIAAIMLSGTFFPAVAADSTEAGTLTVTLTGLKTDDGQVRVALFSSEADYKADKMVGGNIAAPHKTVVTVTFTGLAPGEYALKIFHDLNNNGILDTNIMSIPTEPYAFSNNARGSFGPADWSQAHFTVHAGANTQTITLE